MEFKLDRYNHKITAKIHKFSNVDRSKTEYLELKKLQEQYHAAEVFDLEVYANGRTESHKGFVSISITCPNFLPSIADGWCIISVIDANEEKRYTTTFSLHNDSCVTLLRKDALRKTFNIDKYISRRKLLDSDDNVLSKDILTLEIDIYVVYHTYESEKPLKEFFKVWPEFIVFKNGNHQLLLDSPFVKCLSESSTYFKSMLETPMTERETRMMPLAEDEYVPFQCIGQILMGYSMRLNSVKDIFNTCIVSDKYDIPAVTETCRCLLKLCLMDHTIDEYIELANQYETEYLKELIIKEINLVKESDPEKEIQKLSQNRACYKSPVHGRIWVYIHVDDQQSPLLLFKGLAEK